MLLLRYSYSYFFFLTIPRPPTPTRTATLFPTRRSADLPRPLSAPAGQIRISGETLDRAARAILAKVPKGYGMTKEEARTYAMEAVGQPGGAVPMPRSAGIHPTDRDRHNAPLTSDSDDDVLDRTPAQKGKSASQRLTPA